jgi:hypothetical protein
MVSLEFFIDTRCNPSGRNMALGSTQPLTEMIARSISWGYKGGRCGGLTTLPPGSLNLLEPSGPVKACNGIALPLPLPYPIRFMKQ